MPESERIPEPSTEPEATDPTALDREEYAVIIKAGIQRLARKNVLRYLTPPGSTYENERRELDEAIQSDYRAMIDALPSHQR